MFKERKIWLHDMDWNYSTVSQHSTSTARWLHVDDDDNYKFSKISDPGVCIDKKHQSWLLQNDRLIYTPTLVKCEFSSVDINTLFSF